MSTIAIFFKVPVHIVEQWSFEDIMKNYIVIDYYNKHNNMQQED